LGFDPAAAPLTYDSIGGSSVLGNLLITPVGMVMGGQDNPGAETGRLRRRVGAHKLPQMLRLF
jgi:hypothetical protein